MIGFADKYSRVLIIIMSQTTTNKQTKKITINKSKAQDKPIIDSGGEVIKYPFDYKEFNERFIKLHGEDARCLAVGEENINSKFGTKIGYSATFGAFLGKYVKNDTCKICGHTFGKGQERARHHFNPTRGTQKNSMCYRYANEGLAEINEKKATSKTGKSSKSTAKLVADLEKRQSPKFLRALKTIAVCVKKIGDEEFDFQSVKYRDIIVDAFEVIGDYQTPKMLFGKAIGDFDFNGDIFEEGALISRDDVDEVIQCIRNAFADDGSMKTQKEFIVEMYEADDALDLYPEATIEEIIELQDDFDPFYE